MGLEQVDQPVYVYVESGVAHLYCNNCGAHLELPERGIVPFDGRFCGQPCSDEFNLKMVRHWKIR